MAGGVGNTGADRPGQIADILFFCGQQAEHMQAGRFRKHLKIAGNLRERGQRQVFQSVSGSHGLSCA